MSMKKQRIVVKIGSNVLTREDGKLDLTRISALTDQVAWLVSQGHEVILVSSGAVACGRGEVTPQHKLDPVAQRQLYSALGQAKLINHYYNLFREYGLHVAQVLTMKESFSTRNEYLNQRSCMTVMLENGVIPIVNENDTVSITELMFTDNDELSGLIASMMDADLLILLSNVDGIYDGPPQQPGSHLISSIAPGEDVSGCIQSSKSTLGRGGMGTKSSIARKVADEGIRVIIANGTREHILPDLLCQPAATPHTEFTPSANVPSGVKKWIAHSESFAKGELHINSQAASRLCSDTATSLLMVGVTHVEGNFDEGDIVNIIDPEGHRIAVGRACYDSDTARSLVGMHNVRPVVHYDYLYIET